MTVEECKEESPDPTDRILAEICRTTGLDESATIREMVEALRELGWTVQSRSGKDEEWEFAG